MRATFFGIEIGKTGLSLSQLGLDVTGHNIANVETKGYTRQRIISTAYDPFYTIGRALPVELARVGGGVRVKILDQIRSAYLDRRFRTENTTYSYWNKRTESLSYVESFFDNVDEETSLNHCIANFFEAIKVLAEDPVEEAPRKLLQTAGLDLVQQINLVYAGLIELQESQNQAVGVTVGEINRIALEIVDLNKAIYGFEITGLIANDLRDKRNVLLDELSTFIDVEYQELSDGKGNKMLQVSIGGNVPGLPGILVEHDKSWELGVRLDSNNIDDEDDVLIPYWVDYPGQPDLLVKGGELQAYMDMRDSDDVKRPGIPYYIDMLNKLARALVQEVNNVHVKGWTDPPIPPSENGVWFFDADGLTHTVTRDIDGNVTGYTIANLNDVTAKNIRLSDKIMDSVYNIAASTVKIVKQGAPEEQQRGNNVNANDLYELFRSKSIAPIGSFDGYVTSIRFDVGKELNYSKNTADTSFTLTLAAENQRTSIAGVSLDEEMTSLMKYQHAYSGAARVITAMDDALDRLINGTGRVGL